MSEQIPYPDPLPDDLDDVGENQSKDGPPATEDPDNPEAHGPLFHA
jgi:hypothetical protein